MNIGIEISYLGTAFVGSQIQPGFRTVHGELQRVLSHILRQDIKVNFSGRTDSGVHAHKGFCNFSAELFCEPEKLPFIVNRKLPPDLRVLRAFRVPDDFHARYSAKLKTYHYVFYNGDYDAISCDRKHHCPFPLDFQAMSRAMECLKGEHNFFPFMATGSGKKMTVRNVVSCTLEKVPSPFLLEDEHGNGVSETGRSRGFEYTLSITANGFLYNMVRIIVGTLVDIGRGHLEENAFEMALSTLDRKYLGKTLGAEGLYLWNVEYDNL